jgi:hypothetical protein
VRQTSLSSIWIASRAFLLTKCRERRYLVQLHKKRFSSHKKRPSPQHGTAGSFVVVAVGFDPTHGGLRAFCRITKD